jgi:hypothetical protein
VNAGEAEVLIVVAAAMFSRRNVLNLKSSQRRPFLREETGFAPVPGTLPYATASCLIHHTPSGADSSLRARIWSVAINELACT